MKKIMFCGGGSAGHVIPNIAVLEYLNGSYEAVYLGTEGIEKQICADSGVRFIPFDAVKLVRGKLACNLAIPFKLYKSCSQCREILIKEQPDLLFCKGGYASLPPALAAAKLDIPILTHESDLTPGVANKIIARKAKKTLTSFQTTSKMFKNGVYTGSPMRENLFGRDKLKAKKRFGFDLRPTVLVFGGGSGARVINQTIRKILKQLCEKYNVLHICGKGNLTDETYYGYKQLEFCEDMGEIYACADYAVARCGSNSAHELIAMKIPTLFIPLQNGATRGDQVKNAEYFKALGLCRVLDEDKLGEQSLYENIEILIKDEKLKTALKHSRIECGNRNIAIEIAAAVK